MNNIEIVKLYKEGINRRIGNYPIGLFYNLYNKEDDYHQKAIKEILKIKKLQKKLLTNLIKAQINAQNKGQNEQILDWIKDDCFSILEFTTERAVYENGRLVGYIDIYLEIKTKNLTFPIICELKTGTDDHDNQLTTYFKCIQEEKGIEPLCYYISLNGKDPIINPYNKYIVLTYKDVFDDCFDEQDCEIVVVDYLQTLDAYYNSDVRIDKGKNNKSWGNEAEKGKKNDDEKKMFYYAYFQSIADEIKLKADFTTEVEVFEKECLQSDIKIIDDLDIVSFEKIARIRLTITDPSRDYAKIHLERIFTCEDKYVLVINPDDRYWGEKGKKIYNNLIQHWKDKKKKIKRYNEKSPNDPNDWVSVHKRKDDHWNIAQLLESKNENYNFKSHLDKKRILINFTDPTTWAEWIIADLKRIEDCK